MQASGADFRFILDAKKFVHMVNFSALTSSILLQGNAFTAYRNPTAYYQDGKFYLIFTLVETETDGQVFLIWRRPKAWIYSISPQGKKSPRYQLVVLDT